MSELFRREAVSHAARRLDGAVILATPTSIKTLGLFFAVVIFAAAAFLAQASYARKATVSGYLVPDLGMIRVTAPSGGTLQSIIVHEGDVIRSGDRVAVLGLAGEIAAGNVGAVIAEGLQSESTAAQARAEAKLAQLRVEGDQARDRLAKSRAELADLATQAALQQQRVDLAQAELDRGIAVAAKGFLPRKDVDDRRLALLSSRQDLAGERRQQAEVERDIADVNARLASIPLEIDAARSDAETAAATLRQRRAESEARRQQFVTAPLGGRVAVLPVTTGQTVAAGSVVAVIIPEGGRLEAELLAPSRSIGFIRPGQDVALSLQAFPYQRFGTLHGRVRTVSTTVIAPSDVGLPGLGLQEPVFRIRVSLPRESMDAYGQVIPLQPGMLLSADIVFDRRSLLQWLFDPIYAVAGKP
ncbi:HlyD family efflux transporter periplasmic adaptor subunit [Labrys wisconsinensis]|uniref:Membrane fusion protein n=1 Tax=Labrys wisconsinensis TaxID=425677 RepID=A0ABU0JKH5_9HYPH|nr:HlyD family efflux transporter periplasmic adaptor subunit [Labrys wisconsinensis]MDQ0474785.1 membrane fusion protein [Labrys wisconsinensis]